MTDVVTTKQLLGSVRARAEDIETRVGTMIDLLVECYDYIDSMIEFGGDDGEGDRLKEIGDVLRAEGVVHGWSEHEDTETEDEDGDGDASATV